MKRQTLILVIVKLLTLVLLLITVVIQARTIRIHRKTLRIRMETGRIVDDTVHRIYKLNSRLDRIYGLKGGTNDYTSSD